MNQRLVLCLLLALVACPVLAAEYNAHCVEDRDCHSIYTKSYNCEHHHCIRKAFTYDSKEVFGIFLIVFISMVANAGGLGAGAVIIPVYSYIYDFSPTDAIPLSKITIFAGAIVNLVLSWRERDTKRPNKFQINYNLAAVIIPLLMAGTQIGVILSRFLPPAIIITGLVSYLLYSVQKMYDRGTKEWKKEQQARDALMDKGRPPAKLEFTDGSSPSPRAKEGGQTELTSEGIRQLDVEPIEDSDSQAGDTTVTVDDQLVDQEGTKEVLADLSSKPAHPADTTHELLPTIVMMRHQYANIGLMVMSLVVIVTTALMRGGEGSKSIIGIDRCSSASLVFFIFAQVACILLSHRAYRMNKAVLDEDDFHEHADVDRKLGVQP